MQERIKIFADMHVMDGSFQGSRTFLREIYNLLAKKSDLELFLGAQDIDNLKNNFPSAENIHFVKYKSKSSTARLLFDIPSIIRKNKIDFAHFQYIVPLQKSCKFIVTTHDVIFNEYPEEFNFFYRKIKNLLYKTGARKADILTTVSGYSKKSIEKYLEINSEEIHIIPNSVNPIFFQPFDKKISKQHLQKEFGFNKFILYVSRFEPRKNHDLLLRAFLDLKLYEKGFHLVLLGSKTISTPAFDDILKSLPPSIRSFIFMDESVNDSNIVEFYRAADIFVYPSKAEGFGIPPLEAAAAKTPVVCSNSSSMSDFVFFGDQLFDPFNYEELKMKLERISDQGPTDLALEKIADAVKEKYSWEKSAETLYALIKNN
jgi:glycosyltransferase involved in cell wall biosynthesis